MYISMCLYIIITIMLCSQYILLLSIIPLSFYATKPNNLVITLHHSVLLFILLPFLASHLQWLPFLSTKHITLFSCSTIPSLRCETYLRGWGHCYTNMAFMLEYPSNNQMLCEKCTFCGTIHGL